MTGRLCEPAKPAYECPVPLQAEKPVSESPAVKVTPSDATARRGLARTALALALMTVMAFEILARLADSAAASHVAHGAMFAAAVLAGSRLRLREYYLLSLCALLTTALVALHPAPTEAILRALDQAAFLMAFVLLLGLLHETAATSPAVAESGRFLTTQPSGRRYFALANGTAVMGVLFNLGVVSLLCPLIQRGVEVANPGDPLNPVRERRQVVAMLRGFAWAVVWSPTALAPLALLELIPGIERDRWIALGLAVYVLVMLIGWLEDRLAFRRYRPARGAPRRLPPAFPGRAFLHLAAAVCWLIGLSFAVMWLSADGVVFGLMVACPIVMVGWIAVQNGAPGAFSASAARRRLAEILFEGLSKSAPLAVTLACSGFVGRAAAALIPAEQVAAALDLYALPAYVFLSLIPVTIAVLSYLALSPIMMAVFFGSVLGSLPVLPADPTLTALSISCGWALSMTFAPFATVVLLVSRANNYPALTLSLVWNLWFTLAAAAALVPVFWLLTGGQ